MQRELKVLAIIFKRRLFVVKKKQAASNAQIEPPNRQVQQSEGAARNACEAGKRNGERGPRQQSF